MLLFRCIPQNVITDYQLCMENENSQVQFIRLLLEINDELTNVGDSTQTNKSNNNQRTK